MMRCWVALLVLSTIGFANAFVSPSLPSVRPLRSPGTCSLRMQQGQVDILDKVEQLRVLTALSKSGLLSRIEKEGLLTKLEQSGALSKLEQILPLADQYGAISIAKKLVNFSPGTLRNAAYLLAAAEAGLIFAVPDSDGGLIAAQVVSFLAVVAAMAPLLIGAQLLDIVQGDNPIELPKF